MRERLTKAQELLRQAQVNIDEAAAEIAIEAKEAVGDRRQVLDGCLRFADGLYDQVKRTRRQIRKALKELEG